MKRISMSATMGSSLLNLLRILTPFEVERLTSQLGVRKVKRDSLDAEAKLIAESVVADSVVSSPEPEVVDEGQAKILAFNETATREVTEEAAVANVAHDKFLSKLGLKKQIKKTSRKVVGGEDFEDEDEIKPKEEQVSTTIFLLQEKEKIKKSQLKLVGQDALKTYRIQAAIDTSHEDKEDLSQSSSSGILVNKRQF